MSKLSLGQFVDSDAGHMDATHVPFVVCRLYNDLFPIGPGDYVFVNVKEGLITGSTTDRSVAHGVIDPWFCKDRVRSYDKVLVILNPRFIQSEPVHHFKVDLNAPTIYGVEEQDTCYRTC